MQAGDSTGISIFIILKPFNRQQFLHRIYPLKKQYMHENKIQYIVAMQSVVHLDDSTREPHAHTDKDMEILYLEAFVALATSNRWSDRISREYHISSGQGDC